MANPLPNYEDLGFNKFLQRSIRSVQTTNQTTSNDLNFDSIQTSGSLGDRIQVGGGNIVIDGTNRRITVNDGINDVIVIGETQ